jgi:ATP-dependent DNA helicase RecQ
MNMSAQRILRDVFGFERFRPYQSEIIDRLIEGRDALVLMPTGGGKSLCYQIPAMVRGGTGIVISPLIALMQDQVDGLRQYGVRAAFLNSTLGYQAAREVERQWLAGELDLLYVAPERLMTPRTLELLDRATLALFAIDEAHCVSQWGHDFRPEYLQLSVLHARYPETPRIALTATADAPTRRDIAERLELENAKTFITGFDRPNIRYQIAQKQNSREQMLRFLKREHPGGAGIVYCLSRNKVDNTAEWLCSKGWQALPYHAGMSKDIRQYHQDRFLNEEGLIIVATIAFGMGIDKPNVRFVVHLDLPKSIEAYYQETGRAGRDGLPANAWMTYGIQDVVTFRRLLESSEADDAHKRTERHKLEAMLGLCEITTCRRQALLGYFGEQLPRPCGNCDNCLVPPETWDGTEAGQKALSCVYRTGQRFGVNYLIDILLGKNNPRIQRFRHDKISTFGIGTELSATAWRAVFRQLVARDLLSVDLEGYGSLQLTARSRPVLRGEERLQLRKERKPDKALRKRRAETRLTGPENYELWEALRTHRRRLADQQGVPPYVIFHDATLKEMAKNRPKSRSQLGQISGVGQHKLERYGDEFLEIIRRHSLNDQISVREDYPETL